LRALVTLAGGFRRLRRCRGLGRRGRQGLGRARRHRSAATPASSGSEVTPSTQRIDLLQDTFLIGMPPQHRLARSKRPLALSAFADDDWILPSADGFLARACHAAGFAPRIVSITQDPVATRGLIARDIGVGWVTSLLIDDYNGVAIRPADEPIGRRDIYALLPPGDRHPLAKHVVDALTQTADGLAAP
jgi:DNA-binding transcriptional LysR family regulator